MSPRYAIGHRNGAQTGSSTTATEQIGALATRRDGIVPRWLLLRAGVSRRQIARLIRSGYLRPLYRGVYAVGHEAISRRARLRAALYACGRGAALSHTTGLEAYGAGSSARPIEVTVPRRRKAPPGIRLHVCGLASDEVRMVHGLPTTTAARLVADLAPTLAPERLEHAVNELIHGKRVLGRSDLDAILRRYAGRRGIATLRALHRTGKATRGRIRSPLEGRTSRFLDTAVGLPPFERNVGLAVDDGDPIEVDVLWRRQGVAMEIDGRSAHDRSQAFNSDRIRDRRLLAAGWKPIRVTNSMLVSAAERTALAADLRALLVTAQTTKRPSS